MSTATPDLNGHKVPQMHQRSDSHDYHSRGIYMVTLCTDGRLPLLGTLAGDSAATAVVEPSALGHEVLRCWHAIPELQRKLGASKSERTGRLCTRDIRLLAWQLMPDHFHGIIFIRQPMDIALGDVIRGFMVGCTKAYNALLAAGGAAVAPSPQICGAPNPAASAVSPASGPLAPAGSSLAPGGGRVGWSAYLREGSAGGSLAPGGGRVGWSAYSREGSAGAEESLPPLLCAPLRPLWQKGYHDRILMHRGQLQNMIDYIHDNPRRLYVKRRHRDLFCVQRNVIFARWSFSAVGNVSLLDKTLVAVHVRSYFTDEQRRSYMNGCIIAARRGATLVSPFISEHEQRVRQAALLEGHTCIQLCPHSFPDLFKPVGDLFDPCSCGRLLMLAMSDAPAPGERRITRAECSSLNAVAESMARESIQTQHPT